MNLRFLRSERDRRAALLGLVVLAPGLLWSQVLAPFSRTLRDTAAQLEAERGLLRRELVMLREMDQYPPIFREGIERLVAVQPRLLSGQSPGAQSAALTGYVQGQAQRAGVMISRLEPIEAAADHGELRGVAVRITGESDLEGVLSLLRGLEGGPVLIHVGQLQLRAPNSSPVAAAVGPEVVSFDLVATGFALPGLPTAGPADPPVPDGAEE